MRYERPIERQEGPKQFTPGTHSATITKVIKTRSNKSGKPMFNLQLVGKQEEQGLFFLTFGNAYTEDNIRFILASIEDNGVDIPDIEFGFNKDTYDFLRNKDVYIRVEEGQYLGKPQMKITEFLTLEEFENSEEPTEFDDFGSGEDSQDDWDN